MDDLSTLEMINLILTGLVSYNFKQHVASDIGVDQLFLPSQNIKSQTYLNNIAEWTDRKQMQLNEKKSKLMIINFTKKYQFATRAKLNNTLLDIVDQTVVSGEC